MPVKLQSLLRAGAVLLAALTLCWPAAVNRQPFFHPDTLGYVRGPDVAVMKLLGPRFASSWARLDPGAGVAAHEAGAAPVGGHGYDDKEVLGGRSIYYGVLADLGARTGGFWLTVLVQALAVAWLTEILLRSLGIKSLRAYAAVMALLALASPAAFFICFLMPDIWAGVGIGALAALFALQGRLERLDITVLGCVAVFAAMAHTSVAPVIGVMMAAGAFLGLTGRLKPALGLAVGAAAILAALAGSFAFSAAVRHTVGAPPVTPPFLTARLVDDGTGARFAKAGCGGQAFVVCRYADRFPMDADHFLWGESERDGVFQTVAPSARRALGEEQTRFALAVVRAYPLEQATASMNNILRQIGDTDLSDFNYKPSLQRTFALTLPADTQATMRRTLAAAQGWPIGRLWAWQGAMMILLVVAMGLVALKTAPADTAVAPASQLLMLVMVGVLANGAICGALSSVNGRYEARVIWCVPLALAAWLILRVKGSSPYFSRSSLSRSRGSVRRQAAR